MLKELGKADWMRMLNIPASRIPTVLILRAGRNLQPQYETARSYFSNILEVNAPHGLIENVFIGDLDNRSVGFACVYGAPMAAEIVHIFGVLGARAVIQTGSCMALADELVAGDLFVPTEAFCGEGAARYYKADGEKVTASLGLLGEDTFARFGVEPLWRGAVYTTAALLAEGKADLERWHQQGFSAVDMESATTFAVAEYFGMEHISILCVFDNPRRQEHSLLSDVDKDARRERSNVAARDLALALAIEIDAKHQKK